MNNPLMFFVAVFGFPFSEPLILLIVGMVLVTLAAVGRRWIKRFVKPSEAVHVTIHNQSANTIK